MSILASGMPSKIADLRSSIGNPLILCLEDDAAFISWASQCSNKFAFKWIAKLYVCYRRVEDAIAIAFVIVSRFHVQTSIWPPRPIRQRLENKKRRDSGRKRLVLYYNFIAYPALKELKCRVRPSGAKLGWG
jgi:hypothetical protein